MADRRYGAPPPPTDSEVVNEDWHAKDLSGSSHERVAFVEVDLEESNGQGALFSECTFRECRFNASRHRASAFLNCTFTRCSFFDAEFADCKLVGSTFDRCEFGPLVCEGGDWSFVGLAGAALAHARFVGVRMREVDLTGARCLGTVLRDVDLSGASLHRTDLSGADLRGSDISSLDPTAVTLHDTIVDPDQTIGVAESLGFDVRPQEPM